MSDLPALLGGSPLRSEGPPSWPPPEAADALAAAWRDGSAGRYVGGHLERLEHRLTELHGVGFALTCGSGTFAVEAALRALQVGPGDEVALAAYDYPGNFLSVHALGAVPLLVDLDPDNWNLSVERLAEAVGPATRAVIVSHLHGGLAPMPALMDLARTRGFAVVEDAAQATGALIAGRRAGSWGDVGILSFGGSKLLSAGRGGALLTSRADVAQRARLILTRGGNLVCPLSELQAVALLPQLDRLAARHRRRAESVAWLGERLRELPGLAPLVNHVEGDPAYYKVGLRYDAAVFGLARTRLVAAVQAEGIALDEGFRALHVGRSPNRFRRRGPLTIAERAHESALVLHHPVLLGSDADVEQIVRALARVHAHARRLQ